MNILITGGGGFLGSQLARELNSRTAISPSGGAPAAIDRIVLADKSFSPTSRAKIGPRIRRIGRLG